MTFFFISLLFIKISKSCSDLLKMAVCVCFKLLIYDFFFIYYCKPSKNAKCFFLFFFQHQVPILNVQIGQILVKNFFEHSSSFYVELRGFKKNIPTARILQDFLAKQLLAQLAKLGSTRISQKIQCILYLQIFPYCVVLV